MRRTAALILILPALFAATQFTCAYGQRPLTPYQQGRLAQADPSGDFLPPEPPPGESLPPPEVFSPPAGTPPLGIDSLFPPDGGGGRLPPPPVAGPAARVSDERTAAVRG